MCVCVFVCVSECVCVFVCVSEQSTQAVSGQPISCSVCNRTFSRSGDLKRHKCLDERAKPICEQRGAVQCQHCQRWLRSAGGLAIHQRTCNPP